MSRGAGPWRWSTRVLLACGAVGALLFVAVFLVDGATRPGYDPTYHPVSALSLGGRGWLQITNFVVTGLLLLAFAVGLRRALVPGPAAAWGPILLGVFGLALIGSGVFVMDPMRGYPPPRHRTTRPDPGTTWYTTTWACWSSYRFRPPASCWHGGSQPGPSTRCG